MFTCGSLPKYEEDRDLEGAIVVFMAYLSTKLAADTRHDGRLLIDNRFYLAEPTMTLMDYKAP